jgi:hypothetical protein
MDCSSVRAYSEQGLGAKYSEIGRGEQDVPRGFFMPIEKAAAACERTSRHVSCKALDRVMDR